MFEAPSQTEVSDGRDEPSASAHDRGHDDPQSVAGDAAILRLRGLKVQPIFWSLPDRLNVEDVRTYLVHLASKGGTRPVTAPCRIAGTREIVGPLIWELMGERDDGQSAFGSRAAAALDYA